MSPVQWNSPILFFQNLFFLIRNANRLRLSLPLSIFIAISQEKNVHIGSANDVPSFQCKRAPQQDKMILSCKRQRCRPIDFHLRIGVSCWTIYATPNSLTKKNWVQTRDGCLLLLVGRRRHACLNSSIDTRQFEKPFWLILEAFFCFSIGNVDIFENIHFVLEKSK